MSIGNFSGTGGGITRSESASAGGITLNASATQRTGVVNIDYSVEGVLTATGLASEGSDTINVTISADRFRRFKDTLQDNVVSEIADIVGVSEAVVNQVGGNVTSTIGNSLPGSNPFGNPSNGHELAVAAVSFPGGLSFGGAAGGQSRNIQFGDETVSGNFRFNDLPTVTIPAPSGFNINELIDDSNKPQIRVSVEKRSFIPSGPAPSVTFTVEPSVFVETTELGDVSCGEAFPDIDNRLTSVGIRTGRAVTQMRRIEQDAEQLIGSVQDATNIDPRNSTLDRDALLSVGRSTAEDWIERARDIPTNPDIASVEDLQSQVSSLESDIEGISGDCASQFNNEISSTQDNIEQINDIRSTINDIKSSIINNLENIDLSALEDVSFGKCVQQFGTIDRNEFEDLENIVGIRGIRNLPNVDDLRNISLDSSNNVLSELEDRANQLDSQIQASVGTDDPCRAELRNRVSAIQEEIDNIRQEAARLQGDTEQAQQQAEQAAQQVTQALRSAVASFEGAVETFTQIRQFGRTQERKDELIDRGEELLDRAEDEAGSDTQLANNVRSLLNRVRQTSVRSRTALPCDDRFPTIGRQVQSFEDDVLQLSAPIQPDTANGLSNTGLEIVNNIDNNIPAGDPCREEFTSTVQSLIRRLDTLTARIRVDVSGEAEQRRTQREETEERIQQLLGELSSIRNQG